MIKVEFMKVHVVGGGLAGSEVCWQLLKAGISVTLHEMRPVKSTQAHHTGDLAELVCSNSLKSLRKETASGQLKLEMESLQSLVISAAKKHAVPAGQALAVDRRPFSGEILKRLSTFPDFSIEGSEVIKLPTQQEMKAANEYWVIATGPLTSTSLAQDLQNMCGSDEPLAFYDAIAPILDAESINMDHVFRADRWGDDGVGDYLNIPLDREMYENFVSNVISAEKVPLHDFEETKYFEGCLPIEVMIERGRDTLRFGPMKPAGLVDPKTGKWPWANIQLRIENHSESMFSMVGFQTKMKWPEQKKVFSQIPALENVEFFRYGSIHRNTYMNSPKLLSNDLSLKANDRIFLAGQITGVEGYTESAAIGILAGRSLVQRITGRTMSMPPPSTVIGALCEYVTKGCAGDFQPMNANLGLLPPEPKVRGVSKKDRKAMQVKKAMERFTVWTEQAGFSQ